MKNAMFKVAALSATLILLCVIVVAQNVNNTKSIYGVTVSPNPVTLGPGEVKGVIITPNPGYYHPVITYEGETYEIGQTINGNIFTIKRPENSNSPYSFMVEASDDVTEEESESIGISVEIIPENLWNKSTSHDQSVTVIITVSPPTSSN